MPFRGYFLYIGGALLALLFVVNWYLPPLDAESVRSDVDRSTIRIHSEAKWPKAVVIDTTMPTIVPPTAPATAAAPEPAPNPVREAYAMAEEPPAAKPAEAAKPAKPHVRRPKVARAPAGPDGGYDMFGYRNDAFGRHETFGARRDSFGFRNDFFGPRPMWSSRW